MSDTTDAAFDAGTEHISAAQQAAIADELARAADSAALLAKVDEKLKGYNDQNKVFMKDTIVDVLEDVFGKEQSTYVVKNRVPLLCQSVVDIKQTIIEIKDMIMNNREESDEQHKSFITKDGFWPVKTIVYGSVGIVGTAFISGLVYLVFKTH